MVWGTALQLAHLLPWISEFISLLHIIEVWLTIPQSYSIPSPARNCNSSASVYRIPYPHTYVHTCDHAYHPRVIHNTQYVILFPISHGFHPLTDHVTALSAFTTGLPNITVCCSFLSIAYYTQMTTWYSRSHHLYYHCSVLLPILLWIQISYPSRVTFTPSHHGHIKTSHECLRGGIQFPRSASHLERVSALSVWYGLATKWWIAGLHSRPLQRMPSGHLAIPVRSPVKFLVILTYTYRITACGNGSACSSGKVAGLIFFEVFAYLWASQVIGNVSLATLAGGPYGSKCLRQHAIYLLKFCRLVLLWTKGTRSNAKTPYSICSRTRIDPLPWIYRLWVADRDITRHYEDDLTSCKAKRECWWSSWVSSTRLLDSVGLLFFSSRAFLFTAIEACLACCAECFVGIIENLVEYFNRYEVSSVLAFALMIN